MDLAFVSGPYNLDVDSGSNSRTSSIEKKSRDVYIHRVSYNNRCIVAKSPSETQRVIHNISLGRTDFRSADGR
jgi:hypothetical protein